MECMFIVSFGRDEHIALSAAFDLASNGTQVREALRVWLRYRERSCRIWIAAGITSRLSTTRIKEGKPRESGGERAIRYEYGKKSEELHRKA